MITLSHAFKLINLLPRASQVCAVPSPWSVWSFSQVRHLPFVVASGPLLCLCLSRGASPYTTMVSTAHASEGPPYVPSWLLLGRSLQQRNIFPSPPVIPVLEDWLFPGGILPLYQGDEGVSIQLSPAVCEAVASGLTMLS